MVFKKRKRVKKKNKYNAKGRKDFIKGAFGTFLLELSFAFAKGEFMIRKKKNKHTNAKLQQSIHTLCAIYMYIILVAL